MKLMTEELKNQVPKLYAQDGKGMAAIVYISYFDIASNWRWFITEFDGEDEMFGYVCGLEKEWAYVSLKELQSLGFRIERDLHFTPKTLKECLIQKGIAK